MQVSNMSPAASRFIDLFRAYGTILVVFHHTQNMFTNQKDIMDVPHNPLEYLWWYVAGFSIGHAALIAFFVISGYLVGGTVAQRLMAGKRALADYVVDRTIRIYIVFIPALLLTLIMDTIGRQFFANSKIYEIYAVGAFYTVGHFIGTFFNIQGILIYPFGSNGPMWSLGFEYWYYMIFPLLIMPWATGYTKRFGWGMFWLGIAIYLALAIPPLVLALEIPPSYFGYAFLYWLLGAAVRFANKPLMRSRWLALILWLAPMMILRFIIRLPYADLFPYKHCVDTLGAVLFANLLLTLHFDTSAGFRWGLGRYNAIGSGFSYSYYILHMPLLVLIGAITAQFVGWEWRFEIARLPHYLWTIAVIAIIGVFAYGFSRMTEAHTEKVRALARRTILKQEPKPKA